jgi:hypothetical protein
MSRKTGRKKQIVEQIKKEGSLLDKYPIGLKI